MSKNFTYDIQTFGCKVNTYDSGLLQQRFAAKGIESADQVPQVHILNTCAVTAEATKEAIKQIRRLKARNPNAKVVVTGCGAQVDKDRFEPLPGADLIVANSHKGQLEEIISKHLTGEIRERVFHSNIFKKEDLEEGGGLELEHTRSFLKIQDGCNSFCTYCVIPFARGKSRSLSIPHLVDRVNELYAGGAREVVLTGVHIGDFEDIDTMSEKKSLEDLIEALLAFTKMPRFRLTSLEPVELTPRLVELYQDARLCRHFHMSIQSANTEVLKAMKRNYGALEVEAALETINSKISGSFVGMDVIVGFPGETDEQFEDTYKRLEALPWTKAHVFPYSERPGTKAVKIEPKVSSHKIAERAEQLRELSYDKFTKEALSQIGKVKEGLVLKNPKAALALSRDFWQIQFDQITEMPPVGSFASFEITGYDHSLQSRMEGRLLGRVLTST